MDVIVHEDPGIDYALPFFHGFSETFQKSLPVLIIFKYGGFIDPSHHDVV